MNTSRAHSVDDEVERARARGGSEEEGGTSPPGPHGGWWVVAEGTREDAAACTG
jgi:hypothetical protein